MFVHPVSTFLLDHIRGLALVESAAVTVGDGPALTQGTFLLSERGASEHNVVYTYVADTIGELILAMVVSSSSVNST